MLPGKKEACEKRKGRCRGRYVLFNSLARKIDTPSECTRNPSQNGGALKKKRWVIYNGKTGTFQKQGKQWVEIREERGQEVDSEQIQARESREKNKEVRRQTQKGKEVELGNRLNPLGNRCSHWAQNWERHQAKGELREEMRN